MLRAQPGYVTDATGERVSFHSFPKDKKQIDAWIVKIKRDVGHNFTITKYTRICSRHFTSSDFRITPAKKKYLKDGSTPTVFAWSKPKIKRTSRESASDAMQPDLENLTEMESSDNGASASVHSTDGDLTKCKLNEANERIHILESDLDKARGMADTYRKERDHTRTMIN